MDDNIIRTMTLIGVVMDEVSIKYNKSYLTK